MNKNTIVYLNGTFLPLQKASISIMDRGFHYGDGLFETILAQNGEIKDLKPHLARLRHGAKRIKIRVPYSDIHIQQTIKQLLRRNKLNSGLIKIILTRGPAKSIGLSTRLAIGRPTFCVFVWPISPEYAKKKSFKVIIATIPRDTTPTSGLKSLNYLAHVIAKMEADAAGADEAILVNSRGQVLEGTISNIFILKNGILKTPPLTLGILNGTTRQHVIQRAQKKGVRVAEVPFMVRDLLGADDAFLTFSSAGIMPIQAIIRR